MTPSSTPESRVRQAEYRFRCIGCGNVVETAGQNFRCGKCQDLLEIIYPARNLPDSKESAADLKSLWRQRKLSAAAVDLSGVWRFRDLLPALENEGAAITLREGNTAL